MALLCTTWPVSYIVLYSNILGSDNTHMSFVLVKYSEENDESWMDLIDDDEVEAVPPAPAANEEASAEVVPPAPAANEEASAAVAALEDNANEEVSGTVSNNNPSVRTSRRIASRQQTQHQQQQHEEEANQIRGGNTRSDNEDDNDEDGYESDDLEAYGSDGSDDNAFDPSSGNSDSDDDDDSSGFKWDTLHQTPEEFMDTFFNHLNSDMFEELRRTGKTTCPLFVRMWY